MAEDALGLVVAADDAAGRSVRDDHADGHGAEDGAQPLLAAAQRRFGAPARGDVHDAADHAHGPSVRAAHHEGVVAHTHPAPIRVGDAVLHLEASGGTVLQRPRDRVPHPFAVLGVEAPAPPLHGGLGRFAAHAGDGLGARGPLHPARVRVEIVDRALVGHGGQAEPFLAPAKRRLALPAGGRGGFQLAGHPVHFAHGRCERRHGLAAAKRGGAAGQGLDGPLDAPAEPERQPARKCREASAERQEQEQRPAQRHRERAFRHPDPDQPTGHARTHEGREHRRAIRRHAAPGALEVLSRGVQEITGGGLADERLVRLVAGEDDPATVHDGHRPVRRCRVRRQLLDECLAHPLHGQAQAEQVSDLASCRGAAASVGGRAAAHRLPDGEQGGLRDRAAEKVGYHRPIRPLRFRVELQEGTGQGLAPASACVDELLAREVTEDHVDPGAPLDGRGLRVEGFEVIGLERSEQGDHLGRRDQAREFPVHGKRRGLGDRRSLRFEPGALGIGEAPEQHANEKRDGQRQRERQGRQVVAHGTVTRTTSKGGHVAGVATPEGWSLVPAMFRASPRLIRLRYELYWIEYSSIVSTLTRGA